MIPVWGFPNIAVTLMWEYSIVTSYLFTGYAYICSSSKATGILHRQLLFFPCRWLLKKPDWRGYQGIPQIYVSSVCKENKRKRLHQDYETSLGVSFNTTVQVLKMFVDLQPDYRRKTFTLWLSIPTQSLKCVAYFISEMPFKQFFGPVSVFIW